MDESTVPQSSETSPAPPPEAPAVSEAGKSRAPIIALILIVIAAALFAYTVTRKPSRAMSAAALLPADVAVAMTFDFSQSGGKAAGFAVIRGMMKDIGVEKPEQEMFKSLKQETQVDVEKDVLPLLSGRAGLAVLTEMKGSAPGMAIVLEAKSPSDAAKLVELVAKQLVDKGTPATDAEYNGVKYKSVSTGGPVAFGFGVVKGCLAVGYPESSFKLMVDCGKGVKTSIAKDPNFSKLSKPDSSTVMAVYFSGPGYYKLLGPYLSPVAGKMGPDFAESMKQNLENYVAGVGEVSLTGEGISCKVRGITRDPIPAGEQAEIDDLARMIPKDAALAVSTGDLSKTWASLRKQFEANPSYKKQFDTELKEMNQTIGVDLFKNVVEKLTNLVVYYVPAKSITPGGFAGSLNIVAGITNPEEMRGTIAKVLAAPRVKAVGIKQKTVAGQQVSLFAGGAGKPGILFGQAQGKLVLAVGEKPDAAFASALVATNGKGEMLDSSPGFQAIKKFLPARGEFLMYGDAAGLVNVFRSQMDPSTQEKVDSALGKVSVFGGSGSSRGNQYEYGYVVPFNK